MMRCAGSQPLHPVIILEAEAWNPQVFCTAFGYNSLMIISTIVEDFDLPPAPLRFMLKSAGIPHRYSVGAGVEVAANTVIWEASMDAVSAFLAERDIEPERIGWVEFDGEIITASSFKLAEMMRLGAVLRAGERPQG